MDMRDVARLLHARAPAFDQAVVESLIALALEIAREGWEGRPVGTLFTLGNADAVLTASRALILDPLAGQASAARRLDQPDLRGTVKALAELDGAFIVRDDGVIIGACRYLDVPTQDVSVPLGLGSRHLAAAAASKHLRVLAVAVSQSGVVRVFHDGHCVLQLPNGSEQTRTGTTGRH